LSIDYVVTDIIDTVSTTRIFGIPLTDIIEKESNSSPIPKVVKICIDLITEKHLEVEGLFRISANSNTLDKLKKEIDKGNFDDLMNELEPHNIAGLLKLFIRTLPEPILTFGLFHEFLDVMSKPQDDRVGILKDLFQRLPKNHIEISGTLFSFLLVVSQKSDINKMTSSNLAIVFGPNVLQSGGELMDEVMTMIKVPKVVQLIIENSLTIFSS